MSGSAYGASSHDREQVDHDLLVTEPISVVERPCRSLNRADLDVRPARSGIAASLRVHSDLLTDDPGEVDAAVASATARNALVARSRMTTSSGRRIADLRPDGERDQLGLAD